jgi:hypothetical protein
MAQGLAKLYQKTSQWVKLAEVYEEILKLIPYGAPPSRF